MLQTPTVSEKIKAFVHNESDALMKKCGILELETDTGRQYDWDSIKKFWSDVSFYEIKYYVDLFGADLNICFHKEDSADGVYMVQVGNLWKLYYQERGIKFEEQSFSDESSAILELLAQNAKALGINTKKSVELIKFAEKVKTYFVSKGYEQVPIGTELNPSEYLVFKMSPSMRNLDSNLDDQVMKEDFILFCSELGISANIMYKNNVEKCCSVEDHTLKINVDLLSICLS